MSEISNNINTSLTTLNIDMLMIYVQLTVSGQLLLLEIWKKMTSSPAIIYDTP